MKKITKQIVLFAFLLFTGMAVTAQLKVGTNPTTIGAGSILELESTNKALVVTRVANTAAITTPVAGMMIYDISENCFKVYENGVWSGCLSSATALVAATCGGFLGSYCNGPLSGTTYTVTMTNNDFSSKQVTPLTGDLVLSGISGVNVTAVNPTGVQTILAGANLVITYTITGTPAAQGTLTGTWTKQGLTCSATVPVGGVKTVAAASSTPTLCINTALTAITHATTNATGIGAPTGLPAGVTAAWASNTITISGTPSVAGTFNYTIPVNGCGAAVNATGTITVTPNQTVTAGTTTTVFQNIAMANVTHTTTTATGIGAATGLPAGVTAAWAGNTITISGTPTATGTFNYSIPVIGCSGSVNATGTIQVLNLTVTAEFSGTYAPGESSDLLGVVGVRVRITNNSTFAGNFTAANTDITLTGAAGLNIAANPGAVTIAAGPAVTTNVFYTLGGTVPASGTVTATFSRNAMSANNTLQVDKAFSYATAGILSTCTRNPIIPGGATFPTWSSDNTSTVSVNVTTGVITGATNTNTTVLIRGSLSGTNYGFARSITNRAKVNELFAIGSSTFTLPTDVGTIPSFDAQAWGGGGSGGFASQSFGGNNAGAGGSGGAYSFRNYPYTTGAISYSVGGTATSSTVTYNAVTITAGGGNFGGANGGSPGAAAVATGGSTNTNSLLGGFVSGSAAGAGSAGAGPGGGAGGPTPGSGGANGGNYPGGGGSGGDATPFASTNGGTGAQGRVIITLPCPTP
jgi:hypothetical protein